MAIVNLKWVYTVGFADNSGTPIVDRAYEAAYATFADFAAFQAAATALETILLQMTQAAIATRTYKLVTVEDALVLPPSNVENENQAFFSGKIFGDPTDSATQSIPAADPAIFVATSGPGANVVNTGAPPVSNWLNLFDSNGPWTISDGESWVPSTVKGSRRHSKSSSS